MYEFMDRTLADSFTFYRVPKLLFTDPEFRKMTAESRILYGLLLDRTGLSRMNDWRGQLLMTEVTSLYLPGGAEGKASHLWQMLCSAGSLRSGGTSWDD